MSLTEASFEKKFIQTPSTWKTLTTSGEVTSVRAPLPRSPRTSALLHQQRSKTPRLQLPSWCAKAALMVDGDLFEDPSWGGIYLYIEYVYCIQVYRYTCIVAVYIFIQLDLYDHQILKNPNILHLHVGNNPSILKPLQHWGSDLAWDGMA